MYTFKLWVKSMSVVPPYSKKVSDFFFKRIHTDIISISCYVDNLFHNIYFSIYIFWIRTKLFRVFVHRESNSHIAFVRLNVLLSPLQNVYYTYTVHIYTIYMKPDYIGTPHRTISQYEYMNKIIFSHVLKTTKLGFFVLIFLM